MNTYKWRKNFTAIFAEQEKMIRGKLAFKTKETQWVNTKAPVIALISIHSAFHQEVIGDLKMNAFMSIIKSHVKGKVTVLLSENAHVQTLSLKYENNFQKAFEESLKMAQHLVSRYKTYFEACKVVYWHSYISKDENFKIYLNQLNELYEMNSAFRQHVDHDAEGTYTVERRKEFPERRMYIEKTVQDILEQCACILVLAKKGYQFQFYPGNSYYSTEYVQHIFNPVDQRIDWINVFLTIKKKTIIRN